MKIFLDPQIFWWQKYGGISRYHIEVAIRLKDDFGVQILCPVFYHENEYLNETSLASVPKLAKTLATMNFRGKYRLIQVINLLYAIWHIVFDDYDLFHSTYHKNYSNPWLKVVLVIGRIE